MRGYRDLVAWQKSMKLLRDIYRVTRLFPRDEMYGLTNQLRRAAISVPSNLAEGYGRFSRKEFRQFIGHARGSLLEVETQLEIGRDLAYLDARAADELMAEASEIAKILNGLKTWSEKLVADRES